MFIYSCFEELNIIGLSKSEDYDYDFDNEVEKQVQKLKELICSGF